MRSVDWQVETCPSESWDRVTNLCDHSGYLKELCPVTRILTTKVIIHSIRMVSTRRITIKTRQCRMKITALKMAEGIRTVDFTTTITMEAISFNRLTRGT